jgi:hypothetical protein
MIIASLIGSISWKTNLMCFTNFKNFRSWLNANSTQSTLLSRLAGGEYQKLTLFFECMGITHHVSYPHTHQQNDSVERKHHHIIEVGLSLLAHASMPFKFWDEAFSTGNYLINRLSFHVVKFTSPFEKLFNTQPDYTWFKTFGCAC